MGIYKDLLDRKKTFWLLLVSDMSVYLLQQNLQGKLIL